MPPTNELTAFEVASYLAACEAQDAVDGESDGAGKTQTHTRESAGAAFAHWFD